MNNFYHHLLFSDRVSYLCTAKITHHPLLINVLKRYENSGFF